MGEYDFDERGETPDKTYGVHSIRMHSGYDTKTFENDIAVIRTDRPVDINRSVYPICLPPPGKAYTDTRAFVVGKSYFVPLVIYPPLKKKVVVLFKRELN